MELGKNLNDGDPLQVEIGDDFARFSSDTFTLTTILVDEEFPSYKRVIPMSNSAVATASREAMQACLRRVCALSNKNGAVKWRVEPGQVANGGDERRQRKNERRACRRIRRRIF